MSIPVLPESGDAYAESAQDFQFLADSIPQLVWVTLADGNHIYYNQRWYTYTGLTPGQSHDKGWSYVLHPDDYQRTLGVWQQSLDTGQPYQIEYRFRRHDGTYRWFLGQALPQKDEAGNILKWFGTCTDIHEQKLTQAALLESQQREKDLLEAERTKLYRLLLQAPVGIAIYDGPAHVVELVNPLMADMLGRPAGELLGKPVFEAVPEVRGQGFEAIFRDVFTTGTAFDAKEIPATLRRDGKLIAGYYNTVYQPLKDKAGEITGIIQIVVEVTGQVEARRKVEESQLAVQQVNEQLAAANEELYAANEELSSANGQLTRVNADLDNFVYAASHDLKSPILNIEGLLRVLVKKLPPDNPQEPVFGKAVDLMRDAISRFKGTISDLTEITKIGKANEEITAVELPEVIRHVLLDLEDSIGEADAGVAVEVSQCPEIAFSRKNLHSIVYNLVSNAVKYRSPHRHLELGITCRVEGEYLVLSVADNGLGMDLSGENKIFTMFKRLHNHVEGSGIGLYIVKKIVDNAGGRIEVESQVDAGSTFRVYLRR